MLLSLSREYFLTAHGVRIFVATGFFAEASLNVIPRWFGLMGGFMRVTSGFVVLSAAIARLKIFRMGKISIRLANIVGILDLVNIAASICFVVRNDLETNHRIMTALFLSENFYIAATVLNQEGLKSIE